MWENKGGGVEGEGKYIMRRMIERGVKKEGIEKIWDKIEVNLWNEEGEGEVIDMRLGGK